ncbi:type II toxin-antitoxin system HipA family toxin [Flavobacterium beibuense]|uniref:Hipa domain protein n=1 Tax=Flavobacterium beibuense TaxID=657326 RepID=A0A444WEK4_9FLAO|nr:type II toxin-antitoxin system HipA family toxin [Flavobacterium beibuense]RYJ44257.1 hipa domain protein [Flavobacterium beibuense]
MASNKLIEVIAFGLEIGKLGYSLDEKRSYFQYNPQFLDSGQYSKMFPYIFKRHKHLQIFTQYEGKSFKGLPPMIADSLPDMFGNIIFKEWFESKNMAFDKITPLEQLSYVSNRGMGALEYRPVANIPKSGEINFDEIVSVLQKVLEVKTGITEQGLSDLALLNIFKIGTSAGGARPKILISEHKQTGAVIPGDIEYSDNYTHYLVKLHMDNEAGYNREKVEYGYHLLSRACGIEMMPCKLIDNKHFATERYDRQYGEKQHTLTASGLTGWDFTTPHESTYENLFQLALGLKVPHSDIRELYRRMVFNVVFCNTDDHLKNHSFIYNKDNDSWTLAPAYDITYPLDALHKFLNTARALSINGKRANIILEDLMPIAEDMAIKNPKKIIEEVQSIIPQWEGIANELEIPEQVIKSINSDFKILLG